MIVRVTGATEYTGATRSIGAGLSPSIAAARLVTAREIATTTQAKVPVLTGAARASVKPDALGVGAGAGVPYYGWLEFGGSVGRNHSVHRPKVPEGRYLYPSADTGETQMAIELERVVDSLAARAGF